MTDTASPTTGRDATARAAQPVRRRSGKPLLALQTLRFLAAATVLVHHAGYDADTVAARLGRAPLNLERVFDWSFGIHLFFVLSGFIMIYAERDFGRSGEPRRFLIRRIMRVVPLYWVMTTAVLVGALVAPGLLNAPLGGWLPTLGSYLFVPIARSATETHPVLGQGWTLDYEMMFYLAFALAMTWSRAAGLAALSLLFVALVITGQLLQPRILALQTWTDPLLLEFLFGIAVGLLHAGGARLGRVAAAVLAIVGLAGAVACGPLLGFAASVPAWLGQGGPAALILAAFALGPAWSAGPLTFAGAALGDASYSLYLTHPFVIRPLRSVALKLQLSTGAYLVIACVIAILASLLIFRLVERPMTRALRRHFDAGDPTAGRFRRICSASTEPVPREIASLPRPAPGAPDASVSDRTRAPI